MKKRFLTLAVVLFWPVVALANEYSKETLC